MELYSYMCIEINGIYINGINGNINGMNYNNNEIDSQI